jgi:hypothetical protein
LQPPIFLLQPFDFLSEPQVILLEALEQLDNLWVSDLLWVLVDDLLLQLLVLLPQHVHVVLEQVDVLSHTLHLLLVLLDSLRMIESFTVYLLLEGVMRLLVRGIVRVE